MKVTKVLIVATTLFCANTIVGQTNELERVFPLQTASTGVIERVYVASKLVDDRAIDVWIPDGYSKDKKYNVVYMHDGQMLFDSNITWNKQEWNVDETLGVLIGDKKINDCIVVGVSNVTEKRYADYFPQKVADLLPDTVLSRMKGYLNGKELNADNYLKYLVNEVKPMIDAKYSTNPDAQSTFVMGSSMGGLISIYALCEYPNVFGGAACLSIHSPMASGEVDVNNNILATMFREYLSTNLPKANSKRIYMDYGDQTLDAYYKPYQQRIDVVMENKGWKAPSWETKFFPGTDHSEKSWSQRLSIPFIFLLGK